MSYLNNDDNLTNVMDELFNERTLYRDKIKIEEEKKQFEEEKKQFEEEKKQFEEEKKQHEEEKKQFEKVKNKNEKDNYEEINKGEILLSEEVNRYAIYPLKFRDIYEMYHQQLKCVWVSQEIDLSKDKDHFYKKLNDDERYFIKQILAFFASADAIVNINIEENFLSKIKLREAQVAYRFQAAMEDIHSEMYAEMINNIIEDEDEKNKLYDAINHYDSIKLKKNWAEKWINNGNNLPIGQILIAFAIVEGVFFSGAFCAIYWIKHKPTKDKENLMPGLTSSNEFNSNGK